MLKLVAVALGVFAVGCAPGARSTQSPYTIINGDPHVALPVTRSTNEWLAARAWVANARAELPQRPYVERVRLSVIDPRTNQPLQIRGAVAINPDRAARLVLVGPGGATAIDAWVTPDQYRVEIPSIHLTRRGGRDVASDPHATLGLPVGFLRWWFLSPLGGTLIDAETVWSDEDRVEQVFRFHDDDATIEVFARKRNIFALRRTPGPHIEAVGWISPELTPTSGVSARYENLDVGLRVDVVIEEVMPNEPEPAAFLDPDLEGGT